MRTTWKQIERSREVRLWIKEIVVPFGVVIGFFLRSPENRSWVKNKWNGMTSKLRQKFKKS